MKNPTAAVALLATLTGGLGARKAEPEAAAPTQARIHADIVHGELWERAELSPRDRSLITVAALSVGGRQAPLRAHIGLALDNGLSPEELSEVATHLSFYAGFPVGADAAIALAEVLDERDLTLTPSDAPPLTLDPDREAARKASVAQLAALAPGLAHYTDALLFGEIWRRPGLAPRDRSLVTVAALIAMGQPEQLPFHLERALAAGLTPTEASEVLNHLAFFCGWPRAFSALPVVTQVLAGGQESQGASANKMPKAVQVTPREQAPSFAGPPDKFTGEVQVESLFLADLEGKNGGGMVHFQPGAHTAWHTHPRGQTLIVTAGEGWVQQEGLERHTIRVGDIVRIPPSVRHWHGATDRSAMSHIAIAESVDGSSVAWMELVDPADVD